MAWSIFTQGGGNGAAVTWAQNLLTALGAPLTASNEQFIYDWEKSEGSGGIDNPLNQGPVPGQSSLTTSGSQYGGGAANYASITDGIEGAVDYLNMPAYSSIKSNLLAGNGSGAEEALISSPWAASHYGNGADFSQAPLPGQASAITDGATLTGLTGTSSSPTVATDTGLISGLGGDIFKDFLSDVFPTGLATRLVLVIAGLGLLLIGVDALTKPKAGPTDIILQSPSTLGNSYRQVSGPSKGRSKVPQNEGKEDDKKKSGPGAPFGKGVEGDAAAVGADAGSAAALAA